ncbi:MAG: hypothetical protein KC618_06905 [Candidatus Omnitrophica bacterium]|nr:hypothetical protein [Candidatus Omnitrophota bacterium]
MIRKSFIAAFVTFMCVGSVSIAGALLTTEAKVLEGQVKDVQETFLTVTHESADGMGVHEIEFQVNEDTLLEDMASLENLQEGDRVAVQYQEEDEKNIAVQITKIDLEEVEVDQSAALLK